MDVLLNIFTTYSTCLTCGANLETRNAYVKFCGRCCTNISSINAQLKHILSYSFTSSRARGNVLENRLGIRCRKDFREWARINHPDKGGNSEIFRKVTQLVEQKYPK